MISKPPPQETNRALQEGKEVTITKHPKANQPLCPSSEMSKMRLGEARECVQARLPSSYMVEPRSTGVSRQSATSCLSDNKLDHMPSWCRAESRFMGKSVGSETRKSLCFLTPTRVYNTSVYPYCRGAGYAISKYTILHEDYFEQKALRKSRHRRSLSVCLLPIGLKAGQKFP